jgi:hypothetical protein
VGCTLAVHVESVVVMTKYLKMVPTVKLNNKLDLPVLGMGTSQVSICRSSTFCMLYYKNFIYIKRKAIIRVLNLYQLYRSCERTINDAMVC